MFLRRIQRNVVRLTHEFHTTIGVEKQQQYVDRQGKMLKKLMTGSKHTKRKYFEQSPAKQFKELAFLDSKTSKEQKKLSGKVQKRVKVLNVLFVEQITSLLSTGEVGAGLISQGFEITQVRVVPNFSQVLVYWQPSGTESDDEMETKLRAVAGHLRHELSQLRVIGIVPPITFVKDPGRAKVAEVEAILAKCDFGEDYVPLGVERMKTPRQLFPDEYKDPSEKVGGSCESGSKPEESDDDVLDQSLDEILDGPPMRHDIMGLDREAIMSKITNSLHRCKKDSSSSEAHGYDSGGAMAEDPDRSKEFLQYLDRRRREKARELRRNNKEEEFLRLQRLETIRGQAESLPHDDESPFDGEDYFDEEADLPNSQPRY